MCLLVHVPSERVLFCFYLAIRHEEVTRLWNNMRATCSNITGSRTLVRLWQCATLTHTHTRELTCLRVQSAHLLKQFHGFIKDLQSPLDVITHMYKSAIPCSMYELSLHLSLSVWSCDPPFHSPSPSLPVPAASRSQVSKGQVSPHSPRLVV